MTDQASYAESWEVNWQLDSTTVYGTLVRPAGTGPFPAVVMVAAVVPRTAIGIRHCCQDPMAAHACLQRPWHRLGSPHSATTSVLLARMLARTWLP
jgi:hypothetical protein